MSFRRILYPLAIVAGLLVLTACKTVTMPPYAQGAAPPAEELLAQTRPSLDAIQVPRAKIRANRGVRGDLAFLAQAPDRFRASVTVAGNEMISVSLYEGGYDLIYKLDDLPQGYYHGSSSACAVQVLLGIPLDGTQLVTMVLGGVPVLDEARVVEQRWDKHLARERLLLTDGTQDQELRFASIDGVWRFSGATLWRRGQGEDDREPLWSLDHESWHAVDGVVLPETTRLRRLGRRQDVVRIDYRDQNPDPAFARPPKKPDDDSASQTDSSPEQSDGGAAETTDDPWDHGGEWEGGDAPPSAATSPGPGTSTPPSPSRPEPTASKVEPSSPQVPKLFRLDPGSLPHRHDVCRRVPL